jgi:hypothetical protein
MMKPEAQRIAIAEACGWKWEARIKGSIKVWNKPPLMVFYDSELPNYLNDLNAMHEAEKVLTSSQEKEYVNDLDWMSERWGGTVFAPAAQRAEAFLRTIGKWEGE